MKKLALAVALVSAVALAEQCRNGPTGGGGGGGGMRGGGWRWRRRWRRRCAGGGGWQRRRRTAAAVGRRRRHNWHGGGGHWHGGGGTAGAAAGTAGGIRASASMSAARDIGAGAGRMPMAIRTPTYPRRTRRYPVSSLQRRRRVGGRTYPRAPESANESGQLLVLLRRSGGLLSRTSRIAPKGWMQVVPQNVPNSQIAPAPQ